MEYKNTHKSCKIPIPTYFGHVLQLYTYFLNQKHNLITKYAYETIIDLGVLINQIHFKEGLDHYTLLGNDQGYCKRHKLLTLIMRKCFEKLS